MRKIVQITAASVPETEDSLLQETIYALCNDGTLWMMHWWGANNKRWIQVDGVPDGERRN